MTRYSLLVDVFDFQLNPGYVAVYNTIKQK
jgi:hypothetical protein